MITDNHKTTVEVSEMSEDDSTEEGATEVVRGANRQPIVSVLGCSE